MKDELLNLLPEKLQSDLLWHSKDTNVSFIDFRDRIVSVSSRLLAIQRPHGRPLQGVKEEQPESEDPPAMEEDAMDAIRSATNVEDMIAAFQRIQPRDNRTQRTRPPRKNDDPKDTFGNPRKCPNCNESHPERICPKPSIAKEDRKCWTCGKSGHSSAACPNKKSSGGLKAITDGPVAAVEAALKSMPRPMFVVDSEGFQRPRRPWRGKPGRPTPSKCTIAEFVHESTWSALAQHDTELLHAASPSYRRSATQRCRAKSAAGGVPGTTRTIHSGGRGCLCERNPTDAIRQHGR